MKNREMEDTMKHASFIKSLKLTCALAPLLGGAQQVAAQSIDYSSFEDLFGEPITVGATGTPKRASEVPVNMTIITAEQIRRSGSRDIPEILRAYVGIDVQRTSQNNARVAIRGRNVDSGRMRVLINGRDTFRTYEGVTQWASLPVSMAEIRQIEIVRGPSTSLYGANAVTGVINIVTFNPLSENISNITARIGSTGLKEVSGVATLQFGEGAGGIRISASHFEADIFDAPIPAIDIALRGEPDDNKISVDGLFQVADNIQWGVEFTYFEGVVNSMSEFGVPAYGSMEDYSIKSSLSIDTSSGKWNLVAHRNRNKEIRLTAITLETGDFIISSDIDATSDFIELSNSRTMGEKSSVRFSAGYKNDVTDQFGIGGNFLGTGYVGIRTLYGSALWDYAASEELTITGAARLDRLSPRRTAAEADFLPFTNDDYQSFAELSINLGIVYKVTELDSLKLTYARGFNAPNLFQFGGNISVTEVFLPFAAFGGGPNLRPSIVQQVELSYTTAIEDISGLLSIASYYRWDSGFFGTSTTGRVAPAPSGNLYAGPGVIGDFYTYGIELDLSSKSDTGLHWALRYSFAKTGGEIDRDPSLGTFVADILPFTELELRDASSKHIATAIVGYEKNGFWVDALVNYKSGFDTVSGVVNIPGFLDPTVSIGDAVVGNFTLGYKFESGLSVAARGEGVFHKLQEQSAAPSLAAERRIWLSISYDF